MAESCIAGNIGANVALDDELEATSSLFSETQSRIVVTVANGDVERLLDILSADNVPYSVLGEVGGDRLIIENKIDLSVAEMAEPFNSSLEKLVAGE